MLPQARKERVRLGYLSADFRDHVIGHLIAGMFDKHDRSRFEVFAYSHGEDDGSDFRQRVVASAYQFIDIQELSDEATAARIKSDGIEILIDLNGQIRGNRLEILVLKPAPRQVTFIGYPGSNGAAFIDYMLTDKPVTP